MVEHSGSTGGYRTDITRFPSIHSSVATMCNVSTANSVELAHRAADVAFASSFTEPVPPPTRAAAAAQQGGRTIALGDAEMEEMAGRYHSDELNADYELRRAGGRLVLHRPRAAADTLRATDANTLRGAGMTLRFAAPGQFTADNGRARGIEFVRVAPK
jgi:hypothetical protein